MKLIKVQEKKLHSLLSVGYHSIRTWMNNFFEPESERYWTEAYCPKARVNHIFRNMLFGFWYQISKPLYVLGYSRTALCIIEVWIFRVEGPTSSTPITILFKCQSNPLHFSSSLLSKHNAFEICYWKSGSLGLPKAFHISAKLPWQLKNRVRAFKGYAGVERINSTFVNSHIFTHEKGSWAFINTKAFIHNNYSSKYRFLRYNGNTNNMQWTTAVHKNKKLFLVVIK